MSESDHSEYDELFYPYLFAGGKVSAEQVMAQVRHSTLEKCREVLALRQATLDRYQAEIVMTGKTMAQAFASGGTLFAFGNGGSATDAQDLVADLMFPVDANWKSLSAIALVNDIATITGVANDVGFENVFSRQLIAYGRAGDIAFGLSTSGTSKNVIAALEQAKKQGMMTVGLAGYDGGKMANLASLDFCLVAPGDHVPRIQEAHATVYHALVEVVQACLKEAQA